MNIYLDTNILFTDPFFRSSYSKLLLSSSQEKTINIVIPSICLNELYFKLTTKAKNLGNEINGKIVELNKWTNEKNNTISFDIPKYEKSIRDFYSDKIDEQTFIRLDYQTEYFQENLEKAIKKTAPFFTKMKPNQTLKIILIIFLSFASYHLLFLNFKPIKVGLDKITQQGLISYVLTYFIIGIPIFIGTFIINRTTNILKSLGLISNLLTAIWTSLLFAFPIFIGGLFFFKFNQQIDIENIIAGTIVAGLMEELYFRGFLFGQLFRKTNLGFIPSILFGALIFAFGHLYQSQDVGELVGIFMITFSGAIFFAWLYVEWNYNLWVPVLTHTLMNLSWKLFEIDNNALGDLNANIFRGLTILTAIIFTVLYKESRKEKLTINRQTLILKKKNAL